MKSFDTRVGTLDQDAHHDLVFTPITHLIVKVSV